MEAVLVLVVRGLCDDSCCALKFLCLASIIQVLILGLDGAGKTVFLEQVKTLYKAGGVAVDKIPPTVGLNLGNIQCAGFKVTLWDLGGMSACSFVRASVRPSVRSFFRSFVRSFVRLFVRSRRMIFVFVANVFD